MSVDSTKVYYGYTPYIPKNLAEEWEIEASRATIAIRKDGNAILYGVSICSHNDNFIRKEGRALAEERLNKSPKFIEVPESLIKHAGLKDDHDICLYFLRNMIKSLTKRDKIRREQRRVNKKPNLRALKTYLLQNGDLKKV